MKKINFLICVLLFGSLLVCQSFYRVNSSGNIKSDWQNALYNSEKEIWIGYSIKTTKPENYFVGSIICSDNDISFKDIVNGRIDYSKAFHSNSKQGARILIGYGHRNDKSAEKEIAVLFRIKKGRSKIKIKKVSIFNFAYSTDFGGLDLIWLGEYNLQNSFNFVSGLFNKCKDLDLKEGLIAVAALHKNSTATMFLASQVKDNKYDEIRETAAFWLGIQNNNKALEVLKKVVYNDPETEVKESAVTGIAQADIEKSKKLLVDLINNHPENEIKEKAIFWLGQKDDKSVIKLLKKIIKSNKSEELKGQAIFSLSQSNYKEAIDELINIAYNEKNRSLREKAIFWLGQKAGKKAVSELKNMIDNTPDLELKKRALFALAQNFEEKDIEYFVKLAKTHKSKEIRKHAIFCLGQNDSPKIIEALVDILRN